MRRRRGRRGHRFPRVVLALAATALVATTLAGSPDARAQETTTSVSDAKPLAVGLSLVSQSTWVPLRGTFAMKLHIANAKLAARPNAAISVQIHPSATTRNGFDDVIKNQNLGSILYEPPQIRLSTLPPDAQGNVTIRFGLGRSDVRPTIGINQHGVYPVVVQLVNTDEATRSFVTWLVVVDTDSDKAIDKKLSVSFVLQAVADPIRLPDGTDDPKVVAEMKPGGRLDKIATLLSHTDGLRFSLLVGPETAEAWKRLGQKNTKIAKGFGRLRKVAVESSTQLLPSPYVPIDAAALEAASLGQFLPDEYTKGASALRTAFRSSLANPVRSAFIDPAPTSDAVVNGIRQTLIDSVALRDQALIPVLHQYSPDQAFVLDTTGGDSRGVATAPFIEDLLNGPEPAALRAQQVVAALAEVAYETPAIARGLVIAPPVRWKPDEATMETVFEALRTLPLVQSATLDNLFSTISDEQVLGTNVQRRLVPAVPPATPVSPEEYVKTVSQLAAYRDVVGAKDPVVVAGQAALLTTLSTTISADRAHAELDKINTAVNAFTAGVTADEKRITLTSRRADVPLTFENNLKPARDVKVRVHLESAKLNFPNGADRVEVLKPGSNTIRFTVEARASGTFPMTIGVTSPNGNLQFGAPVLVSVRSAVFGGWAVGVTVAALVFLAGWWANHFRRTRRGRRLTKSSSQAAPPPAPTT